MGVKKKRKSKSVFRKGKRSLPGTAELNQGAASSGGRQVCHSLYVLRSRPLAVTSGPIPTRPLGNRSSFARQRRGPHYLIRACFPSLVRFKDHCNLATAAAGLISAFMLKTLGTSHYS